jgi:hypothetical protein
MNANEDMPHVLNNEKPIAGGSIAASSHQAYEPERPATDVWVVRYVDYTTKYGLGFLFNTGSAGVYFNDSTKIVLSPDGLVFQYIERKKNESNNFSLLRCFIILSIFNLAWLFIYSNYYSEFLSMDPIILTILVSIVFIFVYLLGGIFTSSASNNDYKSRTFFVNGWSAWSYCGSILQGCKLPLFAMPSSFARAFHDGSESMNINITSFSFYNQLKAYFFPSIMFNSSADYIASDMFTVLSDCVSKSCIAFGFLSQKQSFGCISSNQSYDRINVYISCDNVFIPPAGKLETDWFMIHIQDKETNIDPLALYYDLSGRYNNVSLLYNKKTNFVPTGWCSWYNYFNKTY